MLSFLPNGETQARVVYDAFSLADECLRRGTPVDWWIDKANTIRMTAGHDSSEFYILLKKTDLDGDTQASIAAVDKEYHGHKIRSDATPDGTPLIFDRLSFHSARAINPSDDEEDKDTIYLVRFCDIRHYAGKQPARIGISGGLVYGIRDGFNVVSQSVVDDGMSYDESDPDEFPYAGDTLAGVGPYTWTQLLETLWLSSGFTDSFGAMMGFTTQSFPSGGTYPDQLPLDIRPENRTTFGLFIDLLHATGNELYPQFDGTFEIAPIDESFDVSLEGTELANYVTNAVDNGHAFASWNMLPELATMTFLRRYALSQALDGINARNINNYEITSPLVVIGTAGSALVDITTVPPWIKTEHGSFEVDEVVPGSFEDFTTIGRSFFSGSGSDNGAANVLFKKFVLGKYYRARMGIAVDITLPFHVASTPQASYDEVLFYFERDPVSGVSSSRSHFLSNAPPSPGVSSLPEIPGGGSTDRLVAGDDSDEVPETLWTKIVDHGTFDEELHVEVFAEAVTHAAGPPLNKRVKLFTFIGGGAIGPPGADGADGADGTNGTDGADGPGVDPGYAIDVTGTDPRVVDFDPTEITGHAAAFQFFCHQADQATNKEDARWRTILNFNSGVDQFWWHRSGSFRFQTTASYNAAANQILFNQSDVWTWKTTSSYNNAGGVTQLLGHTAGAWKWQTLAEWLNGHLSITLTLSATQLTAKLIVDGIEISSSSVDVTDCAST